MIGVFERIKDRIQGKAPKGAKRSSKWGRVKREHLRKFPECAVCKSKKKVQVHHVIPFHVAPDLELDPTNLVTLCENAKYGIVCHLLVGHLGNYRRTNLSVEADAAYWRQRIKGNEK